MGKSVMAVVDMGTQSMRASFVDAKGNIVGVARDDYGGVPYVSPQNGYCEQWPDFYWKTMVKVLSKLTATPLKNLLDVKGLVVCGFRDSAAYLDARLNPVRPTILWLDSRNARLPDMANLKRWEKAVFRLAGMYETVEYNARRTAAWWIRENEPENWAKIAYYVPLEAYLNAKLTGKLVVSSADAIGHYPIDFKKGTWFPSWNPKWDVFGIPREKLCDLVPCGQVLGYLTGDVSKATGLPQGLPVYASGSDKACEVLGNGCFEKNAAVISFGTACTVGLVTKKYVEPSLFLPAYPAALPGGYNMETQIYRGFWMIRWFMENFASDADRSKAEAMNVNIESVFDANLAKVPAGSDGLMVQPYWGPGLKRPNAKGAILGFADFHDKYHVYRATIEGICYALREGLESMAKRSHAHVDRLYVSGGGSKNDIIAQIACDVFGLPVIKSRPEAGTIGAAMAGFVDAGIFDSKEEAARAMVRYDKRFEPNSKAKAVYDRLYHQVYLAIYPKLKTIDADLKRFQAESQEKPKE